MSHPTAANAKLATEIYAAVVRETESIEGRLGEDLAYLLGAMLTGGKCEWDENTSPLVEILKTLYTEHHRVWEFIDIVEQPKTLVNYYDPQTDRVTIRLANGMEIRSGWTDKHDPEHQLAGDYLEVCEPGSTGQQVFYVEAVDLTTMDTLSAQRKILEFVCACLGVAVPS